MQSNLNCKIKIIKIISNSREEALLDPGFRSMVNSHLQLRVDIHLGKGLPARLVVSYRAAVIIQPILQHLRLAINVGGIGVYTLIKAAEDRHVDAPRVIRRPSIFDDINFSVCPGPFESTDRTRAL